MVLIEWMARKSAGLTRPTLAMMTTTARVALGIRPKRGARKSNVAMITAAATNPDIWLYAPASWFTAVCDVPPPPGML